MTINTPGLKPFAIVCETPNALISPLVVVRLFARGSEPLTLSAVGGAEGKIGILRGLADADVEGG